FSGDIFLHVFSAVERIFDGAVPSASAKITLESKWQVLFLVVRQTCRGHDHARRAIAALAPFGIEARLLHGMQMTVRAQAIDGSDFAIRCAECGNQATMYRLTI